jgi:hypothetical protein
MIAQKRKTTDKPLAAAAAPQQQEPSSNKRIKTEACAKKGKEEVELRAQVYRFLGQSNLATITARNVRQWVAQLNGWSLLFVFFVDFHSHRVDGGADGDAQTRHQRGS